MTANRVRRSARHSPVVLVTLLAATACGPTGVTTSAPATSRPSAASPTTPGPSSASPTPTTKPLALDGRLYFARFDLELMDMTVWVANADGTEARQLVPGGRLLSCVVPTTGQVVVTSATAQGRIVPAIAEGSALHRIPVRNPSLNLGVAACSPDGSEIVAEAWDESDPTRNGLYAVDLTNPSKARRITKPPSGSNDIPGCYLPDGASIAFLRFDDEGLGTLHVVSPDGSAERQVGNDTYHTGPACLPDGDSLIVEDDGALFVVDVANGGQTEITSASEGYDAHKYSPWVSPDGTMLIFAMELPGPYHDLYAMRLDGTGLTRITHSPGTDNELPRWVAVP